MQDSTTREILDDGLKVTATYTSGLVTYTVVKDYMCEYVDPIAFERGESIIREREDPEQPGWWWCTDKRGKCDWVHQSYFECDDGRYLGNDDYNAWDLGVKTGDVLHGIDKRRGWALCANINDDIGWVPSENLK